MLFVHLKFRLVKPGIDPEILSQGSISVSRAHWKMGSAAFRNSATTSTTTSGPGHGELVSGPLQ